MNINIKATNMELTDAISDYVHKRIEPVEKLLKNDAVVVNVEVGKTTNHHKGGDVYKAEIDVRGAGATFFVQSETDDLYTAIDDAKEELVRELTSNKDRKNTLFRRGARSVKKMLKGISNRNPFTSKKD